MKSRLDVRGERILRGGIQLLHDARKVLQGYRGGHPVQELAVEALKVVDEPAVVGKVNASGMRGGSSLICTWQAKYQKLAESPSLIGDMTGARRSSRAPIARMRTTTTAVFSFQLMPGGPAPDRQAAPSSAGRHRFQIGALALVRLGECQHFRVRFDAPRAARLTVDA